MIGEGRVEKIFGYLIGSGTVNVLKRSVAS